MAERILIEIQADSTGAVRALSRLDDGLARVEKGASRGEGTLKRLGRALPIARFLSFAAALSAVYQGFVKSVRGAVELENAMIGVRKTTGLTGRDLKGLERDILSLSAKLGVPAAVLAQYAETAGQLGIEGVANLRAFIETAAKLERVSDLNADAAATGLAKLSNATGVAFADSEKLGSSINELSNRSAATAGELLDAAQRTGAAGSQFGLTADEILGLNAALIDSGIEARVAGTSLRNVLTILQVKAGEAAGTAGVTEEAFRRMLADSPMDALRLYLRELGKLPPQLQAVDIEGTFGRENLLSVQTLAGQLDKTNALLSIGAEAFQDGSSLTTEYEAALDGFTAQWERFGARMTAGAIRVGQDVVPAFTTLLKKVNGATAGAEELAERFATLDAQVMRQRGIVEQARRLEELESQTSRTAEEQDELKRITAELAEKYPEYVSQTNAAGEAVGLYTRMLRQAAEAEMRLYRAQQLRTLGRVVSGLRRAEGRRDQAQGQAGLYRTDPGRLSQREIAAGFKGQMERVQRFGEEAEEFEASIRSLFSTFQRAQDYAGIQELNAELERLGLSWGEIARIRTDGGRVFQDIAHGTGRDAEEVGQNTREIVTTVGDAGDAIEDEVGRQDELRREAIDQMLADRALEISVMRDGTDKLVAEIELDFVRRREAYRRQFGEMSEEVMGLFAEAQRQATLELFEYERKLNVRPFREGFDPPDAPPLTPDAVEGLLETGMIDSIKEVDEALEDLEIAFRSATSDEQRDRIKALVDELRILKSVMAGTGAGALAVGDAIHSTMTNFADAFYALAQAGEGQSKAAFAAYKAFAVAEALVATYLAASKALAEGGPVLGPILAASAVAAGLANVAKIRGITIGAPSGGATGGSAAGGSLPAGTSALPAALVLPRQGVPQNNNAANAPPTNYRVEVTPNGVPSHVLEGLISEIRVVEDRQSSGGRTRQANRRAS